MGNCSGVTVRGPVILKLKRKADIMNARKASTNEVTPHHTHKTKIIEQDDARKRKIEVVHTWLEVIPNKMHKHGGKVLLRKRTNTGNVNTTYVGREKKCKEVVAEYKSRDQFGDPTK